MSLQTDIQNAATNFVAKVAQLVADTNTLDAILTGPDNGPTSLVTAGSQTLKTIARVLAEAIGRLGPFKGDWSNAASYDTGDVVRRSGIYVAVRSNSGVDPAAQTNGPDWYLYAPQADTSFLAAAAWDAESSIASAATTDIGALTTVRVLVTGTAKITSFGNLLKRLRIVRFASTPTITHGANIFLIGGATRIAAANDIGLYAADAANVWRELLYQRANGTPLAIASGQVTRAALDSAMAARLEIPLWFWFR